MAPKRILLKPYSLYIESCLILRMLPTLLQAVIGAGAAGLVTARELKKEGHNVTVFEQAAKLGGTWVYSEHMEADDVLGLKEERRRAHSSLYASLRTNLPREVMGYSDFPFTPDSLRGRSVDNRSFCGHKEAGQSVRSMIC